MNREQYLQQLKKYLKKMPPEDYVDAMDYFTEYFDEAGPENEQAVMETLGSPKQAANDVLSQLFEKQKNPSNQKWSAKQLWGVSFLAILAAPIGIPLAITVIALLFSAILLWLSFILVLASLALAGFLAGVKLILRGVIAAPFSYGGALILVGLGVLMVGIGLLMLLAIPKLWHSMKKFTIVSLSKLTMRKKVSLS
ncbi:DUF1700 domain-containing protein [Enterococcus sp.]|uniref:DUF1700 domain-containing protein n=1 Tax=Enterococcus sp. TaxID=35783 RepID=UPI002FC74A78